MGIIMCCETLLQWQQLPPAEWHDYHLETSTCPHCNKNYERYREGGQVYCRNVEDGTATCADCDTPVKVVDVQHFNGNRQVEVKEVVQYCPTCENPPMPVGTPIIREPISR